MSLPDIETVEIVLTNIKGYFHQYSCPHTGYMFNRNENPNFSFSPAYKAEYDKLCESKDDEYIEELRKLKLALRFNPLFIEAVKNVNAILESDDHDMLIKQLELMHNGSHMDKSWGTFYIDRIPANISERYYKVKYDEFHRMEYVEYNYYDIHSSLELSKDMYEISSKYRNCDELKKESDTDIYMAIKSVNRMKHHMKTNMHIMNPQ